MKLQTSSVDKVLVNVKRAHSNLAGPLSLVGRKLNGTIEIPLETLREILDTLSTAYEVLDYYAAGDPLREFTSRGLDIHTYQPFLIRDRDGARITMSKVSDLRKLGTLNKEEVEKNIYF